ncbi:MAG: efflux RND transporter periplasmic adaptor subunit [Legionellaceae bacterium]|nr:efflux RND transporter periplasmic adaptor subunit [Legionellaceae bacterium]
MLRVLLTGIVLTTLLACQSGEKKPPPPPTVQTMQLKSQEIPLTREYIGLTQSIAAVGIRARVKGFLQQMNFVEGKVVEKDQMLFIIEPQPFEARLELAKAKLAKAIAAMEYQKVEFSRMQQLVAKGDVSKARFDQVSAEYSEAQADVDFERAEVEQAQINLSYCYVHSPIHGTIGQKLVDVGNLVGGTENTLLANVVELDPMYVLFNPSVEDFSLFLQNKDQMPFKVKASLPHHSELVFDGQVDLIDNQADVGTSTILMRATLKNPQHLLLPGIYLNVQLIVSPKVPSLLIPSTAIIEQQTQRVVYTVDSENRVQTAVIQTKGEHGTDSIIQSGLQAGDQIIISGVQRLRPGMKVTPVPHKEAA